RRPPARPTRAPTRCACWPTGSRRPGAAPGWPPPSRPGAASWAAAPPARLRRLPVAEIMSRLDRRLDLLTGTSPVERHQTMRAAIDWGYELLDNPQQELLRRLGGFGGGFLRAGGGGGGG